jgi:hypothetical protein
VNPSRTTSIRVRHVNLVGHDQYRAALVGVTWSRRPPQLGSRGIRPSRPILEQRVAATAVKTDRSDAALLRELLQRGDLPESWIPSTAVLKWRERMPLYTSLVDQRSMWTQRIHAAPHTGNGRSRWGIQVAFIGTTIRAVDRACFAACRPSATSLRDGSPCDCPRPISGASTICRAVRTPSLRAGARP